MQWPDRPPPELDLTDFRIDTTIGLGADIDTVLVSKTGAYLIPGACPGEYCGYGTWTFRSNAVLRERPSGGADSIGVIPGGRAFCADSGFVLIDPPGKVVLRQPPPYPESFGVGDTVLVLNYISEGYWAMRWHDSITMVQAYWTDTSAWPNASPSPAIDVLQAPGDFFWIHATDGISGQKGWIFVRNLAWASDDKVGPCPGWIDGRPPR